MCRINKSFISKTKSKFSIINITIRYNNINFKTKNKKKNLEDLKRAKNIAPKNNFKFSPSFKFKKNHKLANKVLIC